MPKFIYYVAASLDSYIATRDVGFAWLNPFNNVDYGYKEFLGSVNAIVMGRKTYEIASSMPAEKDAPAFIVLSRTIKAVKAGYELWSGSLSDLATELDSRGTKSVWLMGGGIAASSLIGAGLLNEIRFFVIPVILGDGIPAFAPLKNPVELKFIETRGYSNGVTELRYSLAMDA